MAHGAGSRYQKHARALTTECQADIRQMVTSRSFYAELSVEAGEFPKSELSTWALQARMYVSSQQSLIERNASKAAHQPGLFRAVEFAMHNPGTIASQTERAQIRSNALRVRLNRAAPSTFTSAEAERDLETLKLVKDLVGNRWRASDAAWEHEFVQLCEVQRRTTETSLQLPVFEEIDLAIQTLFDLFVKYCELFFERTFHGFAVAPWYHSPGLIAPLAREWSPTPELSS